MNAPARLLRASANDILPSRPALTPRERERRATILQAGQTLMAEYGSQAIGMADFAAAIRMPAATIRRHFADLDNLLGTILREHLMDIVRALGAVPRLAPDRARACRAAYLGATRTGLGAPTAAHFLLIRDRHMLPPDELDSIEAIRANIGGLLAGEQADLVLAVLDTPQIHPSRMEAALGAILAAPISLEAAQPPSRIAPFTPRLRPNPPRWERPPSPPERLNEALRQASS